MVLLKKFFIITLLSVSFTAFNGCVSNHIYTSNNINLTPEEKKLIKNVYVKANFGDIKYNYYGIIAFQNNVDRIDPQDFESNFENSLKDELLKRNFNIVEKIENSDYSIEILPDKFVSGDYYKGIGMTGRKGLIKVPVQLFFSLYARCTNHASNGVESTYKFNDHIGTEFYDIESKWEAYNEAEKQLLTAQLNEMLLKYPHIIISKIFDSKKFKTN